MNNNLLGGPSWSVARGSRSSCCSSRYARMVRCAGWCVKKINFKQKQEEEEEEDEKKKEKANRSKTKTRKAFEYSAENVVVDNLST